MIRTFSRRNFVASAGAGLALAACTRSRTFGMHTSADRLPSHGRTVEEDRPGGYQNGHGYRGSGVDHGLPPTFDPELEKDGANPFKGHYDPSYIALVHVYPRDGWKLDLNYACHPIDLGSTEDQRLSLAVDIFNAKVPLLGTRRNFGHLLAQYRNLYKFRDYGTYEQFNLDDFTFKSQNEIFFFFDNPDILFDTEPLMIFTSRSSSGYASDPNYAFFAARLVDPGETGDLYHFGRIIRVRNYVTDERGLTIGAHNVPTKSQKYSMNIHFTVPNTSGTDRVAFAFDPDTGNGSGYEP